MRACVKKDCCLIIFVTLTPKHSTGPTTFVVGVDVIHTLRGSNGSTLASWKLSLVSSPEKKSTRSTVALCTNCW